MSFTFKKHPKETGLRAVGYSRQSLDIKVNGKVCGLISAPNWTTKDNKYTIRLTVFKEDINEDDNPNCVWRWVTLKFKSESEQECKDFLKSNYNNIVQKYNLRTID